MMFDEVKARSIFVLAQIEVSKMYRLTNGYWGDHPDLAMVAKSPWWLAKTPYGLIRVGWRKRVIEIDWEDTKARVIATPDDVTKGDTYVHAWSYSKAVEYLVEVRRALSECPALEGAPHAQ